MTIVNGAIPGKIFKENVVGELYGADCAVEQVLERAEKLVSRYGESFREPPCDFFSASGRIEICGNHTDHNRGKVLVAAIGVDTLAAASPSGDRRIRIDSEGYPEIVVDLDDLAPLDSQKGSSLALVKGVAKAYADRGLRIGGFRAAITSNVFRGAGVSSSASFELLISEILNVYYNDGRVSAVEKAKISQYAENAYFGKPCGLLDQAGIALGGLSYIDFADPEAPVTRTLTPDFSGYDVVLTNTGGDHSDLTDAYASIRLEMHAVAAALGKSVLREVSEAEFYAGIPGLRKRVSDRALLRAMHFFAENRRIDDCVTALETGDMPGFFAAINASGDSSYRLLQNCYVPGETVQPIPLALALSKRVLAGDGAVRVHGGGFAGTILAFVNKKTTAEYITEMRGLFGAENVFVTTVRGRGACRIDG